MPDSLSSSCLLPAILSTSNILVPLKIDITFKGARLVDTFCWNLYHPALLPEEFAARTCSDLNLPLSFHQRITLQIQEQLQAYRILIDCILNYAVCIPNWNNKIKQSQIITIGIRHGTLDFSDSVEWNPLNADLTPEEFARLTCSDLGLPSELEPAISHKIRETLFRWLLNIIQNPHATETNMTPEFKVTDTKVSLVSSIQAVEMVTNLWKRAKPNSIDEIAAVPQPLLPSDKDSNGSTWVQGNNSKPTKKE